MATKKITKEVQIDCLNKYKSFLKYFSKEEFIYFNSITKFDSPEFKAVMKTFYETGYIV